MSNKTILSTNTLDNAIDYLDKAAYCFNNRKDSHWFKWLMISLHGALYGFGVCATVGINTDRVLKMKLGNKRFEQKKKEIVEFYKNKLGFDISNEAILDDTVKYNLSQLLGIWDVLDNCQNDSFMMQRSNSKVLVITEVQKEAIDRMILYRNNFAHFKPLHLATFTESELWIIKEVVEVIRFLAIESGNVVYSNDNSVEKVKSILGNFNKK
nr:hypothetical protein 5 [Bacillaceae bacterium]